MKSRNETEQQRQDRLDREAARNYRTRRATGSLYRFKRDEHEDYKDAANSKPSFSAAPVVVQAAPVTQAPALASSVAGPSLTEQFFLMRSNQARK